MKLPRYLLSFIRYDTTHYRYNPPVDAIDAGIVERKACGTDYEAAVEYAENHNAIMDSWRKQHRY